MKTGRKCIVAIAAGDGEPGASVCPPLRSAVSMTGSVQSAIHRSIANGHRNRDYRGRSCVHRGGGHRGGHASPLSRHWSPPRHGYNRHQYYPRPVYNYAPPRYLYVAHGVYGYHEHCSHGHGYAYAPGYGSGLSLWLDGIGFSYYERGW